MGEIVQCGEKTFSLLIEGIEDTNYPINEVFQMKCQQPDYIDIPSLESELKTFFQPLKQFTIHA